MISISYGACFRFARGNEHNRRGNKAERVSGLGNFSSRTEAHSLDAIGLASAKGICQHQLGFINCLANRGEHLKGGD